MRDFSMLISLGMIFLMFTSGVFWDLRDIPDPHMAQTILVINPMAFLLDSYRQVLMYGAAPDYFHLLMLGAGFGAMAYVMIVVLRRLSKVLAKKALTA
jgi:lipopolysaccharide transport system permease protein